MLGWMTDIHMNFLSNGVRRKFLKTITDFKAPIVITGDISDGPALEKDLLQISKATEYPVYFVTGNHDYYHSNFKTIRRVLESLSRERENLIYLPVFGIVPFTKDTCLIGTDSWYDGRVSNDLINVDFAINDFNYIQDLSRLSLKSDQIKVFQYRADEALAQLKSCCEVAVKKYKRIIILSHPVPLGRLDTFPNSKLKPFYVWHDAGKYILEFSDQHKEVEFIWLSGHTHKKEEFCVDNFSAYVLGANYEKPRIGAMFDDDFKITFLKDKNGTH